MCLMAGNDFMSLNMSGTEVGATGRLSSPWLSGSANLRCHLQFHYYIGGNACRLSVWVRTDTNFTSLWESSGATSGIFYARSPDVVVPCTDQRYQVLRVHCTGPPFDFTPPLFFPHPPNPPPPPSTTSC